MMTQFVFLCILCTIFQGTPQEIAVFNVFLYCTKPGSLRRIVSLEF